MNSWFIRSVSVLLILLMPVFTPTAYAQGQGELVRLQAQSVFEDRTASVSLLCRNDRFYIDLSQAAQLSELNVTRQGKSCTFSGDYVSRKIDLSAIESVSENGEEYYALEDLMNAANVQLSTWNDGILHYCSVLHNTDVLAEMAKTVLETDTFDANYLSDLGALGDVSYWMANIYDAVNGLRFNALWGDAYEEDIGKMLATLAAPIENEFDLFAFLEKTNKKLSKASDIILGVEEKYEDIREFLYEIPAGGDITLFGVEGTRYIREVLETSKGVNDQDASSLVLRAMLGYAGKKDYEDAVKELKGKLDSMATADIHMYNLADFLSLAQQTVAVTRLSGMYMSALDNILRNGSYSGRKTALEAGEQAIIVRQARELLTRYQNWADQNYTGMVADAVNDILKTSGSNLVESEVKNMLLGKRGLGVKLFTGALNWVDKTDKKTNAVRSMFMYFQIQSLFKACLEDQLAHPSNADYSIYRDGALLYLKSAWHAIDCFSSSNLGSLGLPTERIKQLITDAMGPFAAAEDRCFEDALNKRLDPSDFLITGAQQDPVSATEAPAVWGEEAAAAAREAYYLFLKSDVWLQDIQDAVWGFDFADRYDLEVLKDDSFTRFYLYDVDADGIEELMINPEYAIGESYYLVFSYSPASRSVYLITNGSFQGAFFVYAHSDSGTLRFASHHQDLAMEKFIWIKSGSYVDESEYIMPENDLSAAADELNKDYVRLEPCGITDVEWLHIWDIDIQEDPYSTPSPQVETIQIGLPYCPTIVPAYWAGNVSVMEGGLGTYSVFLGSLGAEDSCWLFTVTVDPTRTSFDELYEGDIIDLGYWSGGIYYVSFNIDLVFDVRYGRKTVNDTERAIIDDVPSIVYSAQVDEDYAQALQY